MLEAGKMRVEAVAYGSHSSRAVLVSTKRTIGAPAECPCPAMMSVWLKRRWLEAAATSGARGLGASDRIFKILTAFSRFALPPPLNSSAFCASARDGRAAGGLVRRQWRVFLHTLAQGYAYTASWSCARGAKRVLQRNPWRKRVRPCARN